MKVIFISILLLNLLQGGWKWLAYKETLFVGEPIILIRKFKNTEDKPIKITEFTAGWEPNRFSLIFQGDSFEYFPGYYRVYGPSKPDTYLIIPGDSIYSTSQLLFWKDFGGAERKPPPFPKDGERFKILINEADSISFLVVEPPDDDSEELEVLKSWHFAMPSEEKSKLKMRLKNLSPKSDYLSPYLYYIQYKFLGANLSKEIEMVDTMKRKFPTHILTEKAEIRLMRLLYREDEKKALEMRKELLTKYPSNIAVRKELKFRRREKR